MYSISAYGWMVDDRGRMDAYCRALRQTVQPGAVVVDLGTGTGIMALLACRCGARRVYAIESEEVIEVARQMAAANGLAEQIVFVRGLSTEVQLPERADVIVSDLRGIVPLFGQHLSAIADARRRFLQPGGTLIPLRDTLWAALVEAPKTYSEVVAPSSPEASSLGFDLEPARRLARNTFTKARLSPEQLLSAPQLWATLDYAHVEDPDVSARLEWTLSRPGTAHGFVVWFDSLLCPGAEFSNAPGEPELIYGHLFFPFAHPAALSVGDTVVLELRADLVGNDYVWHWETTGHASVPSEAPKFYFRQSTFYGSPVSAEQLQRLASSHVPSLSHEGEIAVFVLQRLTSGRTLGEIANELVAHFPARFASVRQALTHAGELSLRYGK